jgi:hypothetical protein
MSAIPEVGHDMAATLVPKSLPSSYLFSDEGEHQFTPLLQPPSTTVDAFMSYPSINLGLLTDQFGEPVAPGMADIRSNTSSVAAINRLPWDSPTHEPKTISGGTFISGNVNYIHATVIPSSKIHIQ